VNNRFVILIGSYNNEQWVEQNLKSILSQTHGNFKVIYYNACSEDKTGEIVLEYAKIDRRIEYFTSPERHRKTWFFEQTIKNKWIEDSDIVVVLDGDDFFANEEVLNYMNEVYNQSSCWVTYGGMIVWNGGESTQEAFPQNSEPPYEVKRDKLYRQDMWRYSHMRTCRGFLWNRLNTKDLISTHDGEYMTLDDLSTVYGLLEMSPADKIFRVPETIYIWNNSKANESRGCAENKVNNIGAIYENEIRNRPKYKELAVVSPTLAGGLGNQMFEVAAAASLAKDNGAQLVVNPSEHFLPNQGKNVNTYSQNIFRKVVFDSKPPVTTRYSWESPKFKPILYTPNVKLGGHYQSYKYFDHNRDYIRNLFTDMATVYDEIDTHYRMCGETTAIQVRRGDYIKFPNHHPMLPAEYYKKAVEMTECDQIYICSDDIEWCKENLKFDKPVQYIKDRDYCELYLIASCKNIVISNSSFGWWAAYLKRFSYGKVIAPSTWFGPALLAEGFNIDDLLPPNWLRI
jgi:glycosyltransferase involved in cell wall biosynthesis